MWQQCLLTLKPRSRGFHLVTDELVAKLPMLVDDRSGMALRRRPFYDGRWAFDN
ncbi:hypothetical protein [Aeromonas allosaccharophila]|uniref:hypothetical protein n=1 Tax=Aeromonas allosaccharophila TaxID=656 RepID=UPI00342C26CE